MPPAATLTLAHWRRTVAELYADVRRLAQTDPRAAWYYFRARRDNLFRNHPQSPLTPAQRTAFDGLPYFPYNPTWRLTGTFHPPQNRESRTVMLPADGEFRYSPVADIHFQVEDKWLVLTLFWVEGYGGGLFLPFQDATSGEATYGGGRYLYDTIKGADLGAGETEIVLDFNFAYNPSCAYDSRWVCPLSPLENRLPVAVTAGEQK